MDAYLCLGFSTKHWRALVHKLDASEEAWQQAVGVFETRMRQRYFRCIDALFAADTNNRSSSADPMTGLECTPGFSIMAVCCLLVETLERFRGSPEPKGKFILRRPAFNDTFKDEKIADAFVNGIRNGILHEAETRRWVIRRDEPAGAIARPESDGYVLNRTLFYDALKSEFEAYLLELREPANAELRQKFRAQMDGICNKA